MVSLLNLYQYFDRVEENMMRSNTNNQVDMEYFKVLYGITHRFLDRVAHLRFYNTE